MPSPAVPTLPLTTPDLVGLDDVDAFAKETKSDLETLEQDVYHVLIEVFGSNPDDPMRGVDVTSLLSGTLADAAKVPRRIEQQLGDRFSDRIDAVSSSLAPQPDGTYLLALTIGVNGSVLGLAYAFDASSGLLSPITAGQ